MIRIMDYGISANDTCFTVGKVKTSTNKNTGETSEVISSPAYTTTIKGAFEIIRKKLLQETVQSLDCDLAEAIKVIKEKEEEFYSLLSKIKW